MYYCLRCPPPSSIILACHAFFIHEFSRPVFLICYFTWVKLESVFSVWLRAADSLTMCAHSRPSWQCSTAGGLCSSFFKAFVCSDKRLIYCCCLVTVSTEISRQATNSASGPSFSAVCMASAVILSKYPSSGSII